MFGTGRKSTSSSLSNSEVNSTAEPPSVHQLQNMASSINGSGDERRHDDDALAPIDADVLERERLLLGMEFGLSYGTAGNAREPGTGVLSPRQSKYDTQLSDDSPSAEYDRSMRNFQSLRIAYPVTFAICLCFHLIMDSEAQDITNQYSTYLTVPSEAHNIRYAIYFVQLVLIGYVVLPLAPSELYTRMFFMEMLSYMLPGVWLCDALTVVCASLANLWLALIGLFLQALLLCSVWYRLRTCLRDGPSVMHMFASATDANNQFIMCRNVVTQMSNSTQRLRFVLYYTITYVPVSVYFGWLPVRIGEYILMLAEQQQLLDFVLAPSTLEAAFSIVLLVLLTMMMAAFGGWQRDAFVALAYLIGVSLIVAYNSLPPSLMYIGILCIAALAVTVLFVVAIRLSSLRNR